MAQALGLKVDGPPHVPVTLTSLWGRPPAFLFPENKTPQNAAPPAYRVSQGLRGLRLPCHL